MKSAYPVIFTPTPEGYVAHVPDFNVDTQGGDLADAIEMARDAIGIMGIDYQDDKKAIPPPSRIGDIKADKTDVVSLVDIDFTAYRKANDTRTIRRNVSIPAWLNAAAEKEDINVSQVLQQALRQQLGV